MPHVTHHPPRRDITVKVRLRADELAALNVRAAASNAYLAAYIRQAALGEVHARETTREGVA